MPSSAEKLTMNRARLSENTSRNKSFSNRMTISRWEIIINEQSGF